MRQKPLFGIHSKINKLVTELEPNILKETNAAALGHTLCYFDEYFLSYQFSPPKSVSTQVNELKKSMPNSGL